MAQGLPDPNQPRNADFYREVEEYLTKRYGKAKQWSLADLMKAAQNFALKGVTSRVPYSMTATEAQDLIKIMQGGLMATLSPYPGSLPAHYAPPPKPEPSMIAGPIIAWRLWKIRQDGILLSVAMNVAWPAGAPLEGIQEQTGYSGVVTRVATNNSAGVYAMKTREHLAGQEYGRDCLVGQVALWGKVIEHEKGYRAEFAYPVMIDLEVKSPMPGFPRPKRRSDLARMIRENYGCEVRE